jgi:hypothetical protein
MRAATEVADTKWPLLPKQQSRSLFLGGAGLCYEYSATEVTDTASYYF